MKTEMKELDLNEMEQVNGGLWPLLIAFAVGGILGVAGNYAYDKVKGK